KEPTTSDVACKLHGAAARCAMSSLGDAHVIVASGVVEGQPLQARCDWDGDDKLPSLCAVHIAVTSP
ncbi:MAG TPA: hypothetical protein VGO62_01745, partial [Myxococcota bacterium]